MAIRIERDITSGFMQRAMERAEANRAAGRVPIRQPDGSYAVPSGTTPDATYVVKVVNLSQLAATCTCANGQAGNEARGLCWHRFQALTEEVVRLGGKVVVKPRRPRPVPAVTAAASAAWIKTGFAR